MDFAERAAMHRKRADECEASAPVAAGSHRRLANMLDELVEDIQKNEDSLKKAAER